MGLRARIGSQIDFQVQGLDEAEDEALSGTCVINGRRLAVSGGTMSLRVREGDPDVSPGSLRYACALRDAAGNAGESSGAVGSPWVGIDAHRPTIVTLAVIRPWSKATLRGTGAGAVLEARIGARVLLRVRTAAADRLRMHTPHRRARAIAVITPSVRRV